MHVTKLAIEVDEFKLAAKQFELRMSNVQVRQYNKLIQTIRIFKFILDNSYQLGVN